MVGKFCDRKKHLTPLEFPSLVGALPTVPDSNGSSRGGISVVSQFDVMPCVWHTYACGMGMLVSSEFSHNDLAIPDSRCVPFVVP